MMQSESINELAQALCNAQADMGGAVKDSANPFFKSKYADLGSVVKAIKEPFAAHGLSYTQFPCSSEGGVGVTTRLMHNSGQWLESSFTLPMVKADPQAAGAAITYARRYALQAMAGIPTADDDAESAMFRTASPYTLDQLDQFISLLASEDALGFMEFTKRIGDDAYTALYNSGKNEKMKLKAQCAALEAKCHSLLDEIASEIIAQLESNDATALHTAANAFAVGPWIKRALWDRLSPEQQHQLTEMKKEAA